MSENLKFYKGKEQDLKSITEIQVGAIYHCEDTGNTYLGVQHINPNDPTILIKDFEIFSTAAGKIKQNSDGTTLGEVFNDYENNKALGLYSHAEGYTTQAIGDSSHAEGCGTIAEGEASHAEGDGVIARGINAHAEGKATAAEDYAHAEGFETSAEGQSSHSEGEKTRAIGYASHASGIGTTAMGKGSFSEGLNSKANGAFSHAEGIATITGYDPFLGPEMWTFNIEDCDIISTNPLCINFDMGGIDPPIDLIEITIYDSAQSMTTFTSSDFSYNEISGILQIKFTQEFDYENINGFNIVPLQIFGHSSHAEGEQTRAMANASHSEGIGTEASGEGSHAEGQYSFAMGEGGSHAEGEFTIALGFASHAEGQNSQAMGTASHSQGHTTIAYGYGSHAEGYGSVIPIYLSGTKNTTKYTVIPVSSTDSLQINSDLLNYIIIVNSSIYATIIDYNTENNTLTLDKTLSSTTNFNNKYAILTYHCATEQAAHVEGCNNVANGFCAHAEGAYTHARGAVAHSEGQGTYAEDAAHAEGLHTQAIGYGSHAEGQYTIANGAYSHVQGTYNIADDTITASNPKGTYAFIIGNGKAEDIKNSTGNIITQNRSNAMTVDWNGNTKIAGAVTTSNLVLTEQKGYGSLTDRAMITNPVPGQLFFVLV